MEVAEEEVVEGAPDGAGSAGADGASAEGGDGGDVGGGAEDVHFGGGGEVGGGDGGFFDGGEDAGGEEVFAGELEDAVGGGSAEDVVGCGDAEGAGGSEDAEGFGGEFGGVAVGVQGEGEIDVLADGFGAHEGVGEVVEALDAREEGGLDGEVGEGDGGTAGMEVHEGWGKADGDDGEQRDGAFGGGDGVAAGAAGDEEADQRVAVRGGGAEDVGEDFLQAGAGPGEGEADGAAAVFEAVPVGGEVVGGTVEDFEGFEDAVAAVDHVVVGGQNHEVGIGGDGVEPGGVHGVVVALVRGAVRGAEGGKIGGGEGQIHAGEDSTGGKAIKRIRGLRGVRGEEAAGGACIGGGSVRR